MEHNDPEKRIAELERRQGRASAGGPAEQPPAYPLASQPGWQQVPNPHPALSDSRPPLPGAPVRCTLYRNPLLYQEERLLNPGGFDFPRPLHRRRGRRIIVASFGIGAGRSHGRGFGLRL